MNKLESSVDAIAEKKTHSLTHSLMRVTARRFYRIKLMNSVLHLQNLDFVVPSPNNVTQFKYLQLANCTSIRMIIANAADSLKSSKQSLSSISRAPF